MEIFDLKPRGTVRPFAPKYSNSNLSLAINTAGVKRRRFATRAYNYDGYYLDGVDHTPTAAIGTNTSVLGISKYAEPYKHYDLRTGVKSGTDGITFTPDTGNHNPRPQTLPTHDSSSGVDRNLGRQSPVDRIRASAPVNKIPPQPETSLEESSSSTMVPVEVASESSDTEERPEGRSGESEGPSDPANMSRSANPLEQTNERASTSNTRGAIEVTDEKKLQEMHRSFDTMISENLKTYDIFKSNVEDIIGQILNDNMELAERVSNFVAPASYYKDALDRPTGEMNIDRFIEAKSIMEYLLFELMNISHKHRRMKLSETVKSQLGFYEVQRDLHFPYPT